MPELQLNDPDLKLLYNAKKEGHQPDEFLLKDTSLLADITSMCGILLY